jgi:hypothetical protein
MDLSEPLVIAGFKKVILNPGSYQVGDNNSLICDETAGLSSVEDSVATWANSRINFFGP